jgi:hypothetical protein
MNKQTRAKEFVADALSEAEINAKVAKLAALSPAVFETKRLEEAKRLRMRANVLDRLVKVERVKSGSGDIDFLAHWTVKPWPTAVDGATLLDDVRKHFLRHVVLPKHADVAVSLWVLHTWVFDCFDVTPYLAVTSPTRRCGKTLLLT